MAEHDPNRFTLLAAEYVLGLMPERTRRRFERRRDRDASLCVEVDDWERRLAPLVESLPPIEPPPHLERAILSRISATESGKADPRRFWRGFAAGAAIAAMLAVLGFGARELALPPSPRDRTIAVLLSATAEPALVLRHAPGSRTLVAEASAVSPLPSGQSYELWVVAPNEPPRSLGLVPAQGTAVLTLDAAQSAALEPGATVAVSVEPAGGSPTGGPTGPIPYQGRIVGSES